MGALALAPAASADQLTVGFSYLGALPNGRMSITTADLGRLAPGRYVAGLLMDDGYGLLARTSFRVTR